MVRLLVAVVLALAVMAPGTAWAGEPPPKGGNDSGCCFQLTNSPVVICVQPGSCTFTAPPAGPK